MRPLDAHIEVLGQNNNIIRIKRALLTKDYFILKIAL
jgi:hypothetical protein